MLRKLDFVEKYMKYAGVNKSEAKRQVEFFILTFKECLIEDNVLVFRNFGIFEKRIWKRKTGMNPKTKEKIKLKQKKIIRFKIGKDFKEKINR